MQNQVREINSFLNSYKVVDLDQTTKQIHSHQHTYLVKNIQLDPQTSDIDNVIATLEQHQTLNSQHILTLLHYQLTNSHKTHIRAVYSYGNNSLQQQIQSKIETQMRFEAQQLWQILYSVTRALQYLSRLNIGYGVLSCDRIFIDEKVKIIDPSAVGEDPMMISSNRLYSPEILIGEEDVDILKSDVYVLGLCILQASLLIRMGSQDKNKYDQTRLRIYLSQVQSLYGAQLSNLLRQMLMYHPQERPSFTEMKEYLQKILDVNDEGQADYYSHMIADLQDQPETHDTLEETYQYQNIDVEEEEQSEQNCSISEFEKAKIKYLRDSRKSFMNSISGQSSLILQNNNGTEKKKITKQIKQKLVKKVSLKDLQIIEIKDYKTDCSRRESKKQNQSMFTNPKFLEDIKKDLQSIALARHHNQLSSKENLYFNY